MKNIHNYLGAIGVFQFARVIDLNMDYYTMRLYECRDKLFIILLSWSKYQHQGFPMGVSITTD